MNGLDDEYLSSEEEAIKQQQDSKIRKVNVLLPLAPHTSELEALYLGSRHRASLGLSQVSDALVIVVSEEKGWISMALQGQLYPNLGTFALLEKLGDSLEDGVRPITG